MTNIFIANLDWEIASEDLKATFSAFGTVSYAHVVYDRETKKSKGYGYVEMDDADEAISAIQALKGLEVNGRSLDVKIASPKGNRPAPKPAAPEKKPFKREGGFQKRETPGFSKRPRTRTTLSGDAQKLERKPFTRRVD
ncbi:MAG: hypothetical protein P8M61_00075 [Crocinitomicaceae bacterium]|jgi:cold-inducible RNA-binding protein|nr:hypothetical protein [Crocinitomicaceae bacterium]MDG2463458.1 hypothetical protein [Crocinitomicaceae bacterium]